MSVSIIVVGIKEGDTRSFDCGFKEDLGDLNPD